jgi:meso-butanediol dehydrogenase/(S,S)-butanediol dehydrogenase/diacetyl reductase
MDKRFEGYAVLLTGATDGIGKATAKRFAMEGANVCITGRREEVGKKALAEIIEEAGRDDCAIYVTADIKNMEDTQKALDAVLEKWGHLDVLVNCGAKQVGGTILEMNPEDYDEVLGTNVKGFGLACKVCIPELYKSPYPSIINVASVNGNMGVAARTLYGASKAAVILMSKAMAQDFAPIRINSISPGFTGSEAMLTNMSRITGISPEECARLTAAGTALRRMATPDEQASVIAFLASKDASYITGENIVVDGGALCVGRYDVALESDPRVLAAKAKSKRN